MSQKLHMALIDSMPMCGYNKISYHPGIAVPPELLQPDFSLLRDLPAGRGRESLHLEHFRNGAKNLYYIGSHHGTDLENISHETIGQAIAKYSPQLIVIEGLETVKGTSPSLGLDPKKPEDVERFFQHSEENIHTAEFVRSKNIPFIGGEASTDEIIGALQGQGYSIKDAMGLFYCAIYPHGAAMGLSRIRTIFLRKRMFFSLMIFFSIYLKNNGLHSMNLKRGTMRIKRKWAIRIF